MMNCFSCFSANKQKDALQKKMLPLSTARAQYLKDSNEERDSWKLQPKEDTKEETVNGNILADSYTLSEIASATEDFHPRNFLCEDGFDMVYKGTISDTNQIVAVKKLDTSGSQGNQALRVEVLVWSVLNHPNMVHLVGYCSDNRVLVYEYMALGSLDYHLLYTPPDQEPLSWYLRMKIAFDVALGLEYLHEKVKPPITYRDLKCSNILLDDQYNAKLSDVRLAKLGLTGGNLTLSECIRTGGNTKSDVYSFGVVILELITGRQAVDETRPLDEQDLVMWAQPMLKDKQRYKNLVDRRLRGRYLKRDLNQLVNVAIMCLQEKGESRPTMTDVILALSNLTFLVKNGTGKPINISQQVKSSTSDKSRSKEPMHGVETDRHKAGAVALEMGWQLEGR